MSRPQSHPTLARYGSADLGIANAGNPSSIPGASSEPARKLRRLSHPATGPALHAGTGTRAGHGRRSGWRLGSLRVKATLIVTLVAVAVLTVLAVGADLQISRIEQDRVLGETEAAGTRVTAAIRDRSLATPIPSDGAVNQIQVVDGRGRVLDSTQAVAGRSPISRRVPSAHDRLQRYTQCDGSGEGCLGVTAIRVGTAPGSPVVYAARPLPAELSGGTLQLMLAGAALALAALIAWSTWWVVGRTLRPVEAIRAQLAEISGADLSLRVPQPAGDDEIALLAATANATLDRLEHSVIRQRRFASDAAHELRTPLAALRVQLEEALLFPDADPYAALREALAGEDRLEKVLADLLLLTRLGTSGCVSSEPVDLTNLVTAEAARRSGVRIRTDLEPGVIVTGVPAHLSRMITNLLDNAEHHADTTVAVNLSRHEGHSILTVTDDGAGIPREERERVFERFARLDTARSREAGGFGLGLTIARDIATVHNGTLVIEDSPQGARFAVRLPTLDDGSSTPSAPVGAGGPQPGRTK